MMETTNDFQPGLLTGRELYRSLRRHEVGPAAEDDRVRLAVLKLEQAESLVKLLLSRGIPAELVSVTDPVRDGFDYLTPAYGNVRAGSAEYLRSKGGDLEAAKTEISAALEAWRTLQDESEVREFFEACLPPGWDIPRVVEMLHAEIDARGLEVSGYACDTARLLQDPSRICHMTERDLVSGKPLGLSRWGDSVLRTVDKRIQRDSRILPGEENPVCPEVAEGERAEFVGRVISVKDGESDWGDPVKVTLKDPTGWRLWLRSCDPAFKVGNVVRFSATVYAHKEDGVTFLSDPAEMREEPPRDG